MSKLSVAVVCTKIKSGDGSLAIGITQTSLCNKQGFFQLLKLKIAMKNKRH